MSEVSFKRGERVVHHKGEPYIVLGISNKNSDKDGFVPTVIYCREGGDESDPDNWYSRPLSEFAQKFTHQHKIATEGTDYIETTLGVFGQINRLNQIFILDRSLIEKRMSQLVGKTVGEMFFPSLAACDNAKDSLKRIMTVVEENEAGTLLHYELVDSPASEDGKVHVVTVKGVVKPSQALKQFINNGGTPYFGIRSLTLPHQQSTTEGEITYQHITDLVCFDVTPENPRAEMITL